MMRKLCAGAAGLMLVAPTTTQAQELLSIEILGPTEIYEQSETQYQCVAHFDVGDLDVTDWADWSVEPAGLGTIDDGLLSVGDLGEDTTLTLSASYEVLGIVASTSAEVSASTAELVGIEIVGPAWVLEQSQTQYECVAHFNVGDSEVVTSLADWAIDPGDVAMIDGGLLIVDELEEDVPLTLSASYMDDDVLAETTLDVMALVDPGNGWLVQVDPADDGSSVECTLSLAMQADAPFVAFAASIFNTLNVSGSEFGDISGWEVLNHLEELTGDLTETDGDSLFGTLAGQLTIFGPFTEDNPIDVLRFTWEAAPGYVIGEGSDWVGYQTSTEALELWVGDDQDSATAVEVIDQIIEAGFGWSVGTCPADVNGDGLLNILDFVAFQLLWQGSDAAADCDANGVLDSLDFVCFQQLFVEGCG